MTLSHNILVIESLSTMPEENRHGIMNFKGRMDAEIKLMCPVTGNHFRTIKIFSEGTGYAQNEVLKNTIQAFINGRIETDTRFYNRPFECIPHSKIDSISIQMPEPFKSLFESLFDMSTWEIPKKELSAH